MHRCKHCLPWGLLLDFDRDCWGLQSQLDDAILPGGTPEEKKKKKKKLSGGAIAGIVIGSVAGVAILVAVG